MIALPNIPPPATEAERTRIAERLAMSSVRNSGSAPRCSSSQCSPMPWTFLSRFSMPIGCPRKRAARR